MKNKFNADELKKKLFGGVKNFMGGNQASATNNTQVNLTTYSGGGGFSNRPSFMSSTGGALNCEINSQRISQTASFNTMNSNDFQTRGIDLKKQMGGNSSPRSLEEVKVNKLN